MARRQLLALPFIGWLTALTVVSLGAKPGQTPPVDRRDQGWKIPPGAESEKSPLTVNAAVIAAGQKIFGSKCQRCHGKTGKGNGPDSEEKYQKDMDLTVASRADHNPDGVVFYRVWNGRTNPKMPVFSQELSKEQIWAVVAYVQTLREK
jgi:mono/diheme cytochrome c family protein